VPEIRLIRVFKISHARQLLGAFILIFSSSVNSFAWGYTGHRIIAEIAEQFLEPQVVRQIRDLLAIENVTTLTDVATWADQIRLQRPETGPWHYVNIPLHPAPDQSSGYDAARDCPYGACVVGKIEQFERVLADRQAPARQRLEALKYLVHFIGDVQRRSTTPRASRGREVSVPMQD
jgi:S1/P1 Nuclease